MTVYKTEVAVTGRKMYFRKWACVKQFTCTGCLYQHPPVKAYFRCSGYKDCKTQFPTARSSESTFLLPFLKAEISGREIEEAKKNQYRETFAWRNLDYVLIPW